jgi:hypothetical protein
MVSPTSGEVEELTAEKAMEAAARAAIT